ncbi:MAG: ABC transporter substrate-binding protein, partial [Pseudomonadota bacterium]
MKNFLRIAVGVVGTAVLATSSLAADKLKVGVLATLEGTYTVLGEDGVRGFNVALKKFGGKAGGRDIEVIIGATDASPDSAVRAVRKLVEQDKVDI